MLRTTIAAFSAGIGGADAVSVLPFTSALGLPDRFARRVARNAQLLLLEESNVARVADPAAGSGGIEDLTEKLCRAAWALFQEIEAAGGAPAALERGLIQDKVAKVRAEHEAATAHRKDVLTGTSDFPNLSEAPVQVLDAKPVPLGPPVANYQISARLTPIRLAEPFERLRDASDRMLAKTGARPKVFLANLGTPRRVHRARELRQELLRGRRHRGHDQRRLQEPRRDDRSLQSLGREARLPLLIRRGL